MTLQICWSGRVPSLPVTHSRISMCSSRIQTTQALHGHRHDNSPLCWGQCYGYGVGLSGNRAVVVTDHRYPRNMSSARAVVSHDNGETWQDEVYYLSHGHAAGYAATISLDEEDMLTLTGSCYGDVNSWNNCIGNTDYVIIRWKLV